ncbi:MAG: hypothetical protein LUD47_06550 [Clostridia bacterium]|nr:hypothetical protein [Clostridia bacterium]
MNEGSTFYNIRTGNAVALAQEYSEALKAINGYLPMDNSVEAFQGFLTGSFLASVSNVYAVYPDNVNRDEFCYLCLFPRYDRYSPMTPGVVIGVDICKEEGEMEKTARAALDKIDRYGCDELLEHLGTRRIDRYGMVYCNRNVVAVKGN